MKDMQRPADTLVDLPTISSDQKRASTETRLRQRMRLQAKPSTVLPVVISFPAFRPTLSPAMTLGLAIASTATLGWALRSWYSKS